MAARGEAGCAQGLGAAAVLLCGAYVLRCVCEGLLSMARRLTKPCIQTATGSGKAGTAQSAPSPGARRGLSPRRGHHTSTQRLPLAAVKNGAMAIRKRLCSPRSSI